MKKQPFDALGEHADRDGYFTEDAIAINPILPPQTEGGLNGFQPGRDVLGERFRPVKTSVTLRLDADIVAWFKANAPHYQTALNAALRDYISQQPA